jgi:hypothetical protein
MIDPFCVKFVAPPPHAGHFLAHVRATDWRPINLSLLGQRKRSGGDHATDKWYHRWQKMHDSAYPWRKGENQFHFKWTTTTATVSGVRINFFLWQIYATPLSVSFKKKKPQETVTDNNHAISRKDKTMLIEYQTSLGRALQRNKRNLIKTTR